MTDNGLDIMSGIGFKGNPSKVRLRDKYNVLLQVFLWFRKHNFFDPVSSCNFSDTIISYWVEKNMEVTIEGFVVSTTFLV